MEGVTVELVTMGCDDAERLYWNPLRPRGWSHTHIVKMFKDRLNQPKLRTPCAERTLRNRVCKEATMSELG